MRRARSAFAVVVVLMLAGACGSSGGSIASVSGAPIQARATADAGTELPDRFTVAPGSLLLGEVLRTGPVRSYNGVTVPERGWLAVLLVTGDPYKVFDHYRAEAARAGMLIPANATEVCSADPFVGFECQTYVASPGYSGVPPTGVSLEMEFARHPARRDEPPASHLLMHFSEVKGPASLRLAPTAPPVPTTGPPPPAFPDDWPALLQPGDRITPALSLLADDKTLAVEPGTQLVAPVTPFSFCVTGGFVAVFEVKADAADVVDRYEGQFKEAEFQSTTFGEGSASGPEARYYASGGGNLDARTVVRDGRPTYLHLSRCND